MSAAARNRVGVSVLVRQITVYVRGGDDVDAAHETRSRRPPLIP